MTTLTTTLSVDKTGGYVCNPQSQTVTQSNTVLTYVLDAPSALQWRIVGLSTTDQQRQTSTPVVAPDGNSVSVTDINTVAETFSVIIYVQHRTTAAKHWIDPEVANDPPR